MHWLLGYPNTGQINNCVELRYETGTVSGAWKNVDCSDVRPKT